MQTTFEAMGGTYQQEGDYLLPDVKAPQSPAIGSWGKCRHKYLRTSHNALYTAMLLGDTLNDHISEVDKSAAEMYDRLVDQLQERDGITDELKATNQMEWIRRMNMIRHEAADVVTKELICV